MSKEAHHKDYRDQSPIISLPENHILAGAQPALHGLVLQIPGERLPYASVRPPAYRALKNDRNVHQNDIVKLHTPRVPKDRLVIPPPQALSVGSEIEMLTIHKDVRTNGHERIRPNWSALDLETALQNQGVTTSPEVWKYMLEVNGNASANTGDRERNFKDIARAISHISEKDDRVQFLPVSSQPFIANAADVHPHPYVQRMVMDILSFDAVADLGASFQVHVEMEDLDSGLFAVNALRKIPHLAMAMSLNGPFLQHQPSELLTTREQARRKMPTGGTLPELPNWDQCVEMSVQKLKSGAVPSLPRALSQHRDLRIRPDITPHGTIEFAFSDNPASNIDKMLMLQELFRLSAWRLYHAYQQGEPLPDVLFDVKNDAQIEVNKKAVEKKGGQAELWVNHQGYRPMSVHDQNLHLLEWISSHPGYDQNPKYPFIKLEQEVRRSLTLPTFTDPDSRSMKKYYQSGIGTPGHYQQALYQYYRDKQNLDPTQAINKVLIDVSDSFHDYLKTTAAS